MRIGIDVDGVLADFNSSFINRVIDVTGRDLFPARPFDITTWNYPEFYGYTPEENTAVWQGIETDRTFWEYLGPYATTNEFLLTLHDRHKYSGDDLYFITSRPGMDAKQQTEQWLKNYWPVAAMPIPTVLISSQKGRCVQALKIDTYVDDRDANVIDVKAHAPSCRTFLLDRPWNRQLEEDKYDITRITNLASMFVKPLTPA